MGWIKITDDPASKPPVIDEVLLELKTPRGDCEMLTGWREETDEGKDMYFTLRPYDSGSTGQYDKWFDKISDTDRVVTRWMELPSEDDVDVEEDDEWDENYYDHDLRW